ncbi:helix-turn-helix transcriptional regulator [Halocynthiibacter sp.]|uniref:helix-turn-helix transcriptional regulator n=1 Tax=Halocynthiibacter sp. TaxID=1979210 RepID=UPI003C59AC33
MKKIGDIDFTPELLGVDAQAAQEEIRAFLDGLGLSDFSFAITSQGVNAPVNPGFELETTYDPEWEERYHQKRYDTIDPLIQKSKLERRPFFWGDGEFLKRLTKREHHFFMEAREFDVRVGCSFPIRERDGTVGLVTFTANDEDTLKTVFRENGTKLLLASHQIMDLLSQPYETTEQENPLSLREREALIWVAQGLTSEEVSDKMFISVSAVNFHLNNSTRKVHARNRHHAALIALQNQFI